MGSSRSLLIIIILKNVNDDEMYLYVDYKSKAFL